VKGIYTFAGPLRCRLDVNGEHASHVSKFQKIRHMFSGGPCQNGGTRGREGLGVFSKQLCWKNKGRARVELEDETAEQMLFFFGLAECSVMTL
jgi:hypothetical protein